MCHSWCVIHMDDVHMRRVHVCVHAAASSRGGSAPRADGDECPLMMNRCRELRSSMGLTAGRFVGGTVAERTNAPALKADESKGSGGSNPPRSAQCTRGRQAAGVVVVGCSIPVTRRLYRPKCLGIWSRDMPVHHMGQVVMASHSVVVASRNRGDARNTHARQPLHVPSMRV